MTARAPLVLGDDGLPQQAQTGDQIATEGAQFSAAPSAPPSAGLVRHGVRAYAGRDLPAACSLYWPEQVEQSLIGRDRIFGSLGRLGAANLDTLPGTNPLTVVGTATARSATSTRMATRAARVGYVSAASVGAAAGVYHSSSAFRILTVGDGSGAGGFHYIARFVPSDAAAVSGAQMFVGLASANNTPAAGDPNAFGNQIGVAAISGSANLQIVFGGSAAQTAIDLGSNFPANNLATDLYEFHLFSSPSDNTKVYYQVDRNGGALAAGGFTAAGTLTNATPGTTLPATTTFMMPRAYRCNNASALAVSLDISSIVIHTPY